ncbi:MAG: DUF2281 domain-containing protein [Thioploca sp.]|nr:DUF2281 domain-containing protein [Thioploca sp.]
MDTSTQIYYIAQTLPISQQVELLHFAEFLQTRLVMEDTLPKHANLAQAFHLLAQLPVDGFDEPRLDWLPEERESL